MAIVTETIQVTVTGANPQTKTFTIPVDTTTGAGVNPLTISLTGVNAGTDTVTATMPSHAGVAPSNAATLVWQATNSPIANGPITIDVYANNSRTKGWPGGLFTGSTSFGRTMPVLNAAPGANSLVFSQVIPNYPIPGFNNQPTNIGPGGGYKLCPAVVVNQTATGQFTGPSGGSGQPIQGTGDGANGNADNGSDHPGFVCDIYGSLVVKTAGTYTFYNNLANEASGALWIQGVTVTSINDTNASGSGYGAFPATSPKHGYSPLCLVNMDLSENAPVKSSYITFPKAGIYPFEAIWNQHDEQQFSGDNNGYWQLTYLSGTQNQSISSGNTTAIGLQPFPVTLASAPPSGSAPTGALRLTPVGGSANLVIQGSSTNLTLTVQNIVYTSIPYCPIWEGTAGSMFIYNSGTNFNFPTYNGNAVDTVAASTSAFAITANNSAISGLFSVSSTGAPPAPFKFNYNGNAFTFAVPGSQISSSSVTVTADDIAWFDAASKKFDLFNGGAGSTSFDITVDYMTKPSVASVSPGSLNASGIAQAVQINLNKPMSPMQQGLYGTGNSVNVAGSVTGGATISSTFTPILDGAGFLQGWSTSITPPVSSTNGTITLSLTVTGTLTFLQGTNFVTQTVTYISGPVATINTLGGFQPPVGVSLTTNPTSTALSSTATTTIIGTEYTFDNPVSCTMQFFKKFISSGVRVNLGSPTSAPTAQSTITVGGKTAYQKTYQTASASYFPVINATTTSAGQLNLGFDVTDNTTGLTTTYQSTTTYQEQVNIVSGGTGGTGGTGGCPAIEMWLDEEHQVYDVFEGMELSCVTEDGNAVYSHGVEKFSFDTALCYRIKTANSAEVVVSASTPIPVRGSMVDAPTAAKVDVGQEVVTDVGNGVEWSEIVEIESVGMRRVGHISLGGRTFAAGTVRGKYIYTHNVQKV